MTFTHALATNNYGPMKFIVATSAANGTHTTLASALAVASVGDTVYLRDSVTENVTLPAGVNIASVNLSTANIPSITGTITMTAAGTSSIKGVRLVTNSAAAIVVSGSSACILNISECYFDFTNSTGITFSNSNGASQIVVFACGGNVGTTGIGAFSLTGAGTLIFRNCNIFNSGATTTQSTASSGNLIIVFSSFTFPITFSGTAGGTILQSTIDTGTQNGTPLTVNIAGAINVELSSFVGGTATAMVITAGLVSMRNSVINSSNASAISGAGTLSYANVTFTSSSVIVSATTQTPLVSIGGGWSFIKTLTAGASASLDFTNLPTYSRYAFFIQNLQPATTATQLLLRFSNDNGATFAATGYQAGVNYTSYNSATVTNVNATTSMPLTSSINNGIGISGNLFVTPTNGNMWGTTTYFNNATSVPAFGTVGGGSNINPNAFRFLASSGNLTSGSVTIFGLL